MLKKIVKRVIGRGSPVAVSRALNEMPAYGFFGGQGGWHEIQNACKGYDDGEIFNKVKKSLLKVKNGDAVYERDSFLFDEIQYAWPLLSCLLKVATESDGRLNIIDFGGSLGSTYFQNREMLSGLKGLRWHIVEQKHFVDEGRRYFQDEQLRFNFDIDEAFSENKEINCLLFSSVLQYIPEPYKVLEHVISKKVPYIIFDRTALFQEHRDVATLQKVPPQIYDAEYPAWFLNENALMKLMSTNYKLLCRWDALGGTIPIYFPDGVRNGFDKGFFFKRIDKDL